MKLANYQYLCIFANLSDTYINIDKKILWYDNKNIHMFRNDDLSVDYIEDTGEILLTLDKNCQPTYISDWAKELRPLEYVLNPRKPTWY